MALLLPRPHPCLPLLLALALPVLPAPALAQQAPDDIPQTETFMARWRNAFVIESTDGRFRLRVGALVQADGRYFVDRGTPPPADATDQFLLRTARPDLEADVWRYFTVRFFSDLAGGKLVLDDVYVDAKIFPELRLRFGKFKVPFGLERFQPESATLLAERAFPTEIAPNRDLGVQVSGDIAGAVLSYYIGVFNGNVDNSTIDAATDDDKEVAARVLVQPFRRLALAPLRGLGLGGGFTWGVRNGSATNPSLLAVHSFGQSQIFSFLGGNSGADTVVASGPRLRWTAHGSYHFWRLGLLGEYVSATHEVQRGSATASVGLSAWHAEATFLLTRDEAAFTGVEPRRPFDPPRGGWGAVGLAARYSGLQIDDSAFTGGFADPKKSVRGAQTFAAGVNWYLTANTRMLFDYGRTIYAGGAAKGDRVPENVFIGRMQLSL